MRREFLRAALIGAILLMSTSTASAAERLIVKIPFDFNVGNTTLRRGTYKITLLYSSTVRITTVDGLSSVLGMSSPNVNGEPTVNVVTFNRYGDRYFMSQVSWSGTSAARRLLPVPAEVELAKNSQAVRVVRLVSR